MAMEQPWPLCASSRAATFSWRGGESGSASTVGSVAWDPVPVSLPPKAAWTWEACVAHNAARPPSAPLNSPRAEIERPWNPCDFRRMGERWQGSKRGRSRFRISYWGCISLPSATAHRCGEEVRRSGGFEVNRTDHDDQVHRSTATASDGDLEVKPRQPQKICQKVCPTYRQIADLNGKKFVELGGCSKTF